VREARAALEVAKGVADVKTPLPNPSVDVVPTYLPGDVLGATRWGVDAGFGWSIPLSGRLRLNDELNKFIAEQAVVNAVATEREQYLALRGEYATLAQAQKTLRAQVALADASDAILAQNRRRAAAGQLSQLQLKQSELEFLRTGLTVEAARVFLATARGRVAARTGFFVRDLEAGQVPVLPGRVPSFEELESVLLKDHPELNRRRAQYETSEKRLALEIAKQYPDLNLLGLWERETNENKFGLGFGIEIPIFDRNQLGIAQANGERDLIRIRFEARVALALAEIEAARARLVAQRRKLAFARAMVWPAAVETLRLARRAREAGDVSDLRFLAAVSTQREVQLEILGLENAVYEAWADLERAVGAPLLQFGERKENKE